MNKLVSYSKRFAKKAKCAAAIAYLAAVNPTAFAADINVNTTLQKMVTILFNVMLFGGIISLAYGVVELFKAFTSGDSDPHAMSKGIGFVIGGIAMIAIKSLTTAIVGSDPTSATYVPGA